MPRSPSHTEGRVAHPSRSYAFGEGLRLQLLHRPATFTILACDALGVRLQGGGQPFSVSMRGRSLVHPSLRDMQDGSYKCEWQATVSGLYVISITLRGKHIMVSASLARVSVETGGHIGSSVVTLGGKHIMVSTRLSWLSIVVVRIPTDGSPFSARAISPFADPEQCRIKGKSAVFAVAGERATFEMEFFDALGGVARMEQCDLQAVLRMALAQAEQAREQWASLSEVPRGFSSIDDFLAGHSLSDRPASPRGRLHHTQLVNLEACEDEHGNALVSCVMDKAGSYLLHISLQHQQIRLVGSPLHVHVVPAAASGPQSKLLTSAAELSLNAGERRALRIQGVDRFGNACVHGGADIKAIGDDSLVCQVHDCSDGTYTLSWHSKSSGRFTLEVLVNGEFLASSPLALHVEPGRLCPSKCTALCQAEDLVAGEAHTVCVVCVDEFGNPVRPSSAEFGVRLRDASGGRPAVPVSSLCIAQPEAVRGGKMVHNPPLLEHTGVTGASVSSYWSDDGSFEICYTCIAAGRYFQEVWCRSETGAFLELRPSYSLLRVVPAAPDAANSFLFEGTEKVRGASLTAGSPLVMLIRCADRFGNSCAPSAGELLLRLQGPSGETLLQARPHREGGEKERELDWELERKGSGGEGKGGEGGWRGIYSIHHPVTLVGEYSLSCTLHGLQVGGSPVNFSVQPAEASGLNSVLLEPSSVLWLHEPCIFLLQPRDRWGNLLPSRHPAAAVGARIDGPSRPPVVVTDLSDGTVETLSIAGESAIGHEEYSASSRLHFPSDAHADAASARLEHGILSVRLPRHSSTTHLLEILGVLPAGRE
ncbi:MAG: hypothetical protein SGPRY_006389, partial [Prymnesium sp.]